MVFAIMSSKAIRSWLASFLYLSLVISIIPFLTYVEIPEKNKDLLVSIVGMLVGSLGAVIAIFTGRDPDDVADLKKKIEELNDDRSTLIARLRDAQIDKETLRRQHEHLQNQVIEKLSVFVGREQLLELGKPQLSEEIERWIPKEKTVVLSDISPMAPPRPTKPPPPGPHVNPRDFDEFKKKP